MRILQIALKIMDGLHANWYSRVRLAEGYALMSRSVARPGRRSDTTNGVRQDLAYVVFCGHGRVLWVVVVDVDG